MCRDGINLLLWGQHSEYETNYRNQKQAGAIQQRCMGRDLAVETEAFGSAILYKQMAVFLVSDATELHKSQLPWKVQIPEYNLTVDRKLSDTS